MAFVFSILRVSVVLQCRFFSLVHVDDKKMCDKDGSGLICTHVWIGQVNAGTCRFGIMHVHFVLGGMDETCVVRLLPH